MVSIVTCGAPILPFAGRSTSSERQDGGPTSYYRDHHGHPATQGDSLHLLLQVSEPMVSELSQSLPWKWPGIPQDKSQPKLEQKSLAPQPRASVPKYTPDFSGYLWQRFLHLMFLYTHLHCHSLILSSQLFQPPGDACLYHSGTGALFHSSHTL